MSLGVVIKGPEGIVLAADSRVTLEAQKSGSPTIHVNYDNATKLLSFSDPHKFVGCVTYGCAVIGLRTAHSFIPEFEQRILAEKKTRLTIKEYSQSLSKFFMERWREGMPSDYPGQPMTFIVGGYDEDLAYGKVFVFDIPTKPDPVQKNANDNEFGMTWGGQLEVANRLIHGYDPALLKIIKQALNIEDDKINELAKIMQERLTYPIPYNVLPLQDCVDLSIYLIRTTMLAQKLSIGIRGVGGPIDVAIVTRTNGLKYIQQKMVHGELKKNE